MTPDPTTNLRRWRRELIGREGQKGELRQAFEAGTQVVTVTGPPGVGKSRLTHSFAWAASGEGLYRGGVWRCDLVSAVSGDGLENALWAAMPPTHRSGAGEGSLAAALRGVGPALWILDNADGVVGELGERLLGWMDAALESDFLITARQRLQIEGERVFVVAPLSVEAGVRLFERRARAVHPGFEPDPSAQQAIERLVGALDGLPLAIELAASRVRVLPPRAFVERLDERMALLRKARGGVSDPHRTLESAIEASWEVLEPDLRDALAQCAVFRGGFSLRAAEAALVLEGGLPVADAIEALCDRSLVTFYQPPESRGEMRFALLETIRCFAAAKLDASEGRDVVERRCIEHYVSEGGRRLGEGVGGLEWLALELDNLLNLHQRFVEVSPALSAKAARLLEPLVGLRGTQVSRFTLLDLSEGGDEGADKVDAGLLYTRARGRLQTGWPKGALDDLLEAHRTSSPSSLPGLRRDILLTIGRIYQKQGDRTHARHYFEQVLDLSGAQDDPRGRSDALTRLAQVEAADGHLVLARTHYEAALGLLRAEGRPAQLAAVLNNLGGLLGRMGSRAEARRAFAEGLTFSKEAGEVRTAGVLLTHMARLDHEAGALASSATLYARALEAHREAGSRRSEALALTHRALLRLETGAISGASGDIEGARALARALKDRACRLQVRLAEALLAMAGGQVEAAGTILDKARRDAHKTRDVGSAALVEALGELSAALREPSGPDATRGEVDEAVWVGSHASALWAMCAAFRSGVRQGPAEGPVILRVTGALLCGVSPSEAAVVPDESELVSESVRVGPECRWIAPPRGPRINLRRRPVARRLVAALISHHAEAPGDAISTAGMIEAGWPGERLLPDSARNRLYVALSGLRKLGLAEVIQTRNDGYLLDPREAVVRVEAA